jgi:hypothetical protein
LVGLGLGEGLHVLVGPGDGDGLGLHVLVGLGLGDGLLPQAPIETLEEVADRVVKSAKAGDVATSVTSSTAAASAKRLPSGLLAGPPSAPPDVVTLSVVSFGRCAQSSGGTFTTRAFDACVGCHSGSETTSC